MMDLPDGILWAQLSQDRSSSGTGSSVFDFDGDGLTDFLLFDHTRVDATLRIAVNRGVLPGTLSTPAVQPAERAR